ncbi:MAG TPA: type II secretion protein [Nitrospirae bacterium]|nr:type II secretion protein [Nitrospirota bacterium]
MMLANTGSQRFLILVERGILADEELRKAEHTAVARSIDLERVLLREYNVPRFILLKALSEYYQCPTIEYDERMLIPPGLLSAVNGDMLSISRWFPVIKDGDTVIIAANNPEDPAVLDEAKRFIKAEKYEFRVALAEDIQWFVLDFLHARPGYLLGTERTGLSFWRTTMARWRTRLACCRTDMATARTGLAFLRWGLGFIAVANTLIRTQKLPITYPLYWSIIAMGFFLGFLGLSRYLKIRRSEMNPPERRTIVGMTSATMGFLKGYHLIETTDVEISMKKSILARIADLLASHCTILYPSPSSRERTHLARERSVLGAQRTMAACYRTIYARARTGLALIRTGFSFASFGIGLMHYFGLSSLSVFDAILIVAGTFMVVDGLLWYIPVRKEQSELPSCPIPQ